MEFTLTIGTLGYNNNLIGGVKTARSNNVTHGKQKGVKYIIKVL